MSTVAAVTLWGRRIGAVSQQDDRDYAAFEYDADFLGSGIEVSPLHMPLSERIYVFPELSRESFHGLPGLLADSLPDKYGNALIDTWLASQGRTPDSFNSVERLCYTGARGMGALEFEPAMGPAASRSKKIEVEHLVRLAEAVLKQRTVLDASFNDDEKGAGLADILQVGTSAGGARAKAIIAWNEQTNEVRSGQVPTGEGFSYWLLKFDGVAGNRDKELEDPKGYGAIEYAYYLMARAAGISMRECRLLDEGPRRHFMARRFDRTDGGGKIHMQSLGALAHFDYNNAGAYSYEQAMLVMRRLGLSMGDLEEQYRRMVFNIVARNQDDHVKNIAFLMDKKGRWSLSPAFDVTYSYNPYGRWTAAHQMSMNGKRDEFTLADFKACAKAASMKRGRAESILKEVQEAAAQWSGFAKDAGVIKEQREQVRKAHRLIFSA